MQKVWTLLALLFIATIFYRVAYVVPYDTCNDIWLQAERRQTDPDWTDFVAQCTRALENSDLLTPLTGRQGPKDHRQQVCRAFCRY